MAREVHQFAITVPAGTPKTSPVTTPMVMPAREVRRVEITVPPGPGGYVGFAIGAAGTIIIPANAGQWIVTDDEKIGWDLDGAHNSGSWSFVAYNTGRDDHTIYVRFLVDLAAPPSVAPIDLIAPNALAFGGN